MVVVKIDHECLQNKQHLSSISLDSDPRDRVSWLCLASHPHVDGIPLGI